LLLQLQYGNNDFAQCIYRTIISSGPAEGETAVKMGGDNEQLPKVRPIAHDCHAIEFARAASGTASETEAIKRRPGTVGLQCQ
jgi:hypothetical protein